MTKKGFLSNCNNFKHGFNFYSKQSSRVVLEPSHPIYRKMSAINRLITKKKFDSKKESQEYRRFKTAVKSHFLEIFSATEQKS